MIQIDRHIEVLLLDNDCVIVPDLGGFMAYHVPARYVKETGQFIPPSRQLGFNAQLKINDSLLAQSYIEAYDISYPEALRRIEAEVEEMRQMIQNTGMCELNDIGVLRVNEHGSMEFEPCEAGILTPGLYGLNTLDMMPLSHKVEVEKKPVVSVKEKKTVKEQKEDDVTITPIVPSPINIVAKDEDEVVDEDDEEDDDDNHGRTFTIVKRVAAIAAVILALVIISIPFGSPSHQLMSRSYLDSGFLYNLFVDKPSTPNVKPVAKHVAKQVKKVATPAKKVLEAKVDTPKVEVKNVDKAEVKDNEKKSGPYYAIVLASCVSHKSATREVAKMKKDGFNEGHVVDRSNGSKLIYGHYATEDECRHALHDLRSQNEDFESGWIMKFK